MTAITANSESMLEMLARNNNSAGSIEAQARNVIEAAMARAGCRQPAAVPTAEEKRQQAIDAALARRLAQLRTAMGEDEVQPAARPVMIGLPQAVPQAQHRGPATLVVACLLSALAGAGAMWLAIGRDLPPPAPQLAAATVQPALPVAPPATPEVAPAPVNGDEEQARELLESWRQAWSSRNADAYLECYSPDFVPAGGQGRAEWAAARRKNLGSRPQISVEVSDLRIERIDADRMELRFLQDYAAGSYHEKAQPKSLLLVRQDKGWRIAAERQG